MAHEKEKTVRVTCPVDGERAFVSLDSEGCLHCSHSAALETCPTRCGARSILVSDDKAVNMMVVCPTDGTQARVTMKSGGMVYCSHQKDMPDCGMDCIKPL